MAASVAMGDGAMSVSLTDPLWTSFVEGHPDATPFHHPAWAGVLTAAYRFDASALLLVDGDGRVEAGLPLIHLGRLAARSRGVSLPFTDWVSPLLRPDADRSSIDERLEAARRALGLHSLEVRDELGGSVGYRIAQGYRHVLALQPDPEALLAGFDRSRIKRKLRRAEREKLSIRQGGASDLLEIFYPLHVTTRRRLGVPVQPRRFFDALGSKFLEAGLGHVVSAFADGTPLASVVVLAWNRHMFYKYAASSRELGDVGATQAVVWHALRWGCENGYVDFDFGRTDLGHEGLRTYKSAWGSDERALTYTVLADREPRQRSGRAGELLGTVIRHSPELVTRAIGRAAYRYTA